MTDKLTGGCQCGALRYEVTGAPKQLIACHCTDCQKQSGSAFGMTMVVDEADFRMVQGEVKKFTTTTDAGRSKTGAFCPECGSREINRRPSVFAAHGGRGLPPNDEVYTYCVAPRLRPAVSLGDF